MILQTLRKVCVFAGFTLLATSLFTTEASAKAFTDVKKTHYAYPAIQWAQKEGIVSGFSDGSFGPNKIVTEAQFAKMLVEYFDLNMYEYNSSLTGTQNLWSEAYYATLAQHGVPLNGYFEKTLRNSSIERGLVAHSMNYLFGGYTNLYDSVDSFIGSNISTGQYPEYKGKDTLRYFGYKNSLTRAQAVTFFYRLEELHQFHKEDYEYRYDYEYTRVNYVPLWAVIEARGIPLADTAYKAISTIHPDLRKGKNKSLQLLPDAFLTYGSGQGIVGGKYFPVDREVVGFISDSNEQSDTVYVKVGQQLKIRSSRVLINQYEHTFYALDEQYIDDILDEELVVKAAGEFMIKIEHLLGYGDTLYIHVVSEQ